MWCYYDRYCMPSLLLLPHPPAPSLRVRVGRLRPGPVRLPLVDGTPAAADWRCRLTAASGVPGRLRQTRFTRARLMELPGTGVRPAARGCHRTRACGAR
eukprot:scaffold879_cov410-Prasinococcus_capsulatus_cf.AAC.18